MKKKEDLGNGWEIHAISLMTCPQAEYQSVGVLLVVNHVWFKKPSIQKPTPNTSKRSGEGTRICHC